MQAPQDKARNTTKTPTTLRDQAAEFDRLQQENFNLKMRNSFLEEQLLSLKRGDVELSGGELEAEVTQLQGMVKQRDLQMAEQAERASQAVGILAEQLQAAQAELDRCRGASGRQHSVPEDAMRQLEAKLQTLVEAERQNKRRVRELLENEEMLRSQLKEARCTFANELRVAEERKQRHFLTLQFMKRERDNALEELGRVRAMHDARSELVTALLERVEALRRQKRKLGSEYVAKLQAIYDEIRRGRQEQVKGDWTQNTQDIRDAVFQSG